MFFTVSVSPNLAVSDGIDSIRRRSVIQKEKDSFLFRCFVRSERADDLFERLGVKFGEFLGDFVDDSFGGGGIGEGCGSDLNGSGAGDEEFERVVGGGDSADRDQREIGKCAGDFPGHAESDRFDRGAAEPADVAGEDRPASPPVDRHSDDGVDQADGVGASRGGALGDRDDAGDVRRQFGDHGERASPAHPRDESFDHLRIDSQVEPVANVGARKIEFDRGQAGFGADDLGHLDELILVFAGDVDDHRGSDGAEVRQVLADEVIESVVIEADRVEQSRGGFDGSGSLVAGPRFHGDGFGDDAAEAIDPREARHFANVAERSRSREDGIFERQPPKLNRKVDHSNVPN